MGFYGSGAGLFRHDRSFADRVHRLGNDPARAPLLDTSLFRQRTFTGSSIAAFGLSMAVLGPVLCLVVYMSFDQGDPELTIGTHLLLLTGVTLPFLPLTGFLDRYIPVRLLICGGLVR